MTIKDKKEIEELINKFRLVVSTHGGDVQLVGIKNNKVELRLLGACANCSLANLSYNTILGGLIRERFPEVEIKFNKNNKLKKQQHAKLKRIYKG